MFLSANIYLLKRIFTKSFFFPVIGKVMLVLFAEFITHGVFEISSQDFNSKFHRQRYDALLWEHATSKLKNGAISESEDIGTVASKFGGPSINREPFLDMQNYQKSKPRTRISK